MLQRLRPWVLPIAMLLGLLFHTQMEPLGVYSPWLLFAMLLLTFCRINPSQMRIGHLAWAMLAVQTLGATAIYLLLRPWSETLAIGAFVCLFCPTATAAPVITAMLGGSIAMLVGYSIVCNVATALLAPALLAGVHGGGLDTFFTSMGMIATRIVPVIILPLAVAFLLRRVAPRLHRYLGTHASASFYIWALSLVIIVGQSVGLVMGEAHREWRMIVALTVTAGAACIVQFVIGRWLGRHLAGDAVAGGQALAQKNTVLALWVSLTWLDPLVSVAPAAYIAWQNTFNALQIWHHQRKMRGEAQPF